MKTILIFPLAVFILLAGCVPAPSDPYTLIAAGETMLKGTQAAATQTAESVIRANEAAVLQQMQTQASVDNAASATAQILYSNATATALYFDAQATQAAATAQAIATQEAQNASATRQAVELAQLQAGATATQQAALSLANAEAARLAREKVVTVILWVAVFAAIGLFIFLAYEFGRIFNQSYGKQRAWIHGAESFIMDTQRGPVIVTPRKMFSPAMQIEAQTGAATMPQLSPLDAQMYTTLAALAVELQREVSKRAQWFTPLGKSGEAFAPMPENPIPAALPMPELKPLPMFTDRHILIAGATGTGKTHTARYLLQNRESVIVLDPHAAPDGWPNHCEVIGGGRDFESIARVVSQMIGLMNERYQERGRGLGYFPPLTLAVDEIPAIVAHQPAVAKMLMQIGMEGRKAGVYLVLLSQSVLVRSLHIEGQGDLRENFATVKLNALPPGMPQDTPRTATVLVGNLHKPESEENYIIPALSTSAPKPPAARFDLTSLPAPQIAPQAGGPEQAEKIRVLYAEGQSMREIQKQLFGYTGGAAYEAVKQALESATTTTPAPVLA